MSDLSFIDDGSVALTVTSPPYHNAIDYDRHLEKKRCRGKDLAKLARILSHLLR
ncbi:MAG: hypothetical protein M1503_02410 [Thaumarchaeota archaeon]|nr:hypothetical protein [Nitrososphaerota archaeon]MCL5317105.1 hypothetical protein [Nitrososphaerota archaeon]